MRWAPSDKATADRLIAEARRAPEDLRWAAAAMAGVAATEAGNSANPFHPKTEPDLHRGFARGSLAAQRTAALRHAHTPRQQQLFDLEEG